MYKLIIVGNVQGVGFRKFTKSTANSLGIKGYVKNLPDGSVEIVADTTKEHLEEFIVKLHLDHEGSTIGNIKVSEEDPSETYKDFAIVV